MTYLHTENDKQIKGSEKINFCALVKKFSEALNVLSSLYLIFKWIKAPFVSNSLSRKREEQQMQFRKRKLLREAEWDINNCEDIFIGFIGKDTGCYWSNSWKITYTSFSAQKENFSIFLYSEIIFKKHLHHTCIFWAMQLSDENFSCRVICMLKTKEVLFFPQDKILDFLADHFKPIKTCHLWSVFLAL